jgi:7,8-dihydropterin-6-yl-methyl-4-(beta-D-ribofuranosyl)aminobenzene 5'-phosphate synthase
MRILFVSLLAILPLQAQPQPVQEVETLRVQVLSTMLTADRGIGEWGFSAVVDVDGHRILFDTGDRPETVLNNSKELHVDLSSITDVILSHNHEDHTGGLMTLRQAVRQQNPTALSKAHVGKGIFAMRRSDKGLPIEFMIKTRGEFESSGGTFVEYDRPAELWKGVWLTGPVPRKYPERNWSGHTEVQVAGEWKEDTVAEDMSLVVNTRQGLVVLSGCGHAGVINTLEYVRTAVRNAPIYAALGGFHLFQLDDAKLDWTASKLRDLGIRQFLGAHCTGIEPVFRIRQNLGLDRRSAAVAAVGAVFDLETGLNPGSIAR